MNEEAWWRSIPAAAFNNLLPRPLGGRIRRHLDMENLTAGVMDHEEDIECAKEDRLDAEEITRPNSGSVLFQEWTPARGRPWMVGSMHVLGNCSSGDFEPKPGELCLDPALTPKTVLNGHTPDEGL